jgi:Mor family transcriptional regulator
VTIQKRKLSAQEEQTLAREHEAGHAIAELERQFKLSDEAVLQTLHRAGVEMRAKAPRSRRE